MNVAKAHSMRVAAVLTTGLVVSAGVVWMSTYAAFSGSTENSGNSFSSGSVSLTDDDLGGVMFNVTGLAPGDTGSRCIEVTYTGTVASSVELYTTPSSVTGDLAQYVDFTVEQGTGGNFADCAGFTPDATGGTIHNGTLATFGTSYTSYATGTGTWTPSTSGATKTYRFTYTLQDNNAAQAKSAGIGFTWEAQSS